MDGDKSTTENKAGGLSGVSPSDTSSSSANNQDAHTPRKEGPRLKAVLNKSKETAHHVLETSKENAHYILQTSKDQIEHNGWLFPLRFVIHFPRNWPRTSAFLFGVLMPLWAMIFVSMGFGILLAQYEMPSEVEANDSIVRARARIDYTDFDQLVLLNATQICLTRWQLQVLGKEGNWTGLIRDIPLDVISNTSLIAYTESTIEEAFLEEVDPDGDGFILINQTLMKNSLLDCADSFLPELRNFQEAQVNNSEAFDSLSFNWIRCWDGDLYGRANLIFHPTDDMIAAAHPDSQSAYFEAEWTRMQEELYQQYLPPDATVDDELRAFIQSIEDATGGGACTENMSGTAWFFFTIMTTVGYGNQAPTSSSGRLLVASCGLLSLILFGAVLGLCGYVLLAIFDDTMRRFWFAKFLTNPVIGMVLWGTIWLLYALTIATDVQWWWKVRLPEFGAEVTREDALWFAFISTSTIGLGDYFLQPEVVFASDALKYSGLFMIGFVLLSTFFGKIAESLSALLPKKHNSLESRLQQTRVVACWPYGFMPWEAKPEDKPGDEVDVVDMVPDDQALIYRIEELQKLKPDPSVEDDGQEDRGLVSTMTGNPIHSMNVELLSQEESLLQEWLTIVQNQKAIAIRKHSETQMVEVIPEDPESLQAADERAPAQEEESESGLVHVFEDPSPDDLSQPGDVFEDDARAETNISISSAHETFNPLAQFPDQHEDSETK